MSTITEQKRKHNPHQPVGRWIRANSRRKIYERDSYKCHKCGRDLRKAPRRERTLDHVKPVSQGGTNKPDNLKTACRSCNSRHGLASKGAFMFTLDLQKARKTKKKALRSASLMPSSVRAKYGAGDYGSDDDDAPKPPKPQPATVVGKRPTMKSFDIVSIDDLYKAGSKAKGAGSRGGKIIGHTKSGKPIYANKHSIESTYTRKDHADAAFAHESVVADMEDSDDDNTPAYTPAQRHHEAEWTRHDKLGDKLQRATRNEEHDVNKAAHERAYQTKKSVTQKSFDVVGDVSEHNPKEHDMSKSTTDVNFEELFSDELNKSLTPEDRVILDCPHCNEGITKSQVLAKASAKMVDQNNGGKNNNKVAGGKDGTINTKTPVRPKGKGKHGPALPGNYGTTKKSEDADVGDEDGGSEEVVTEPVVKSAGGPRVIGGTRHAMWVETGDDAAIAKTIESGAFGHSRTASTVR